MHRRPGMPAVLLGALVFACGGSADHGACPATELTVRTFSGPPVVETRVECADGRVSTLCTQPLSIGMGTACDATTITIWPRDTELAALVLYISRNDETAFAWIRGGCDEEPCDSSADEALDGWIELEESSEDIIKGAFDLTLENGGLLGTFDTTQRPAAPSP